MGGPSNVFRRYLEAGISFLKDIMKKVLCRKVVGFDVNALYLQCCRLEMLKGFYVNCLLTTAGWFFRVFRSIKSLARYSG